VSARSYVKVSIERAICPELFDYLMTLKPLAQQSFVQLAFDMHVASRDSENEIELKVLTRDIDASPVIRAGLVAQAAIHQFSLLHKSIVEQAQPPSTPANSAEPRSKPPPAVKTKTLSGHKPVNY
jgi:hypothetical protein